MLSLYSEAIAHTLHPLPSCAKASLADATVTGWYGGVCPRSGRWLCLPRTRLSEAIAHALMQELAACEDCNREGKMYGVLLVKAQADELYFLKAFSGLLNGSSTQEGWVPPIPGRDRIAALELETLNALQAIKQELIQLETLSVRQVYHAEKLKFDYELKQLLDLHQNRKQARDRTRQQLRQRPEDDTVAIALQALNHQSQQDGIERRNLKAKWNAVLHPLQQEIDRANARIAELKQQRKSLSRQLQAEFYTAHHLTNFAGDSQPLQALMPSGFLPTGTGDCCAPKLLHYAATHGLTPIALAEFWWGPSPAREHRVQGQFYEACAERCQPLMGFLLSGLSAQVLKTAAPEPLEILYEDPWLLAVNKPSGLLSVPGRYGQDSAIARLSTHSRLYPAHRLDQNTSGVLLLAKDAETHRALHQQFQQRQVQKVYEALLSGRLASVPDEICLPLWGDPAERPQQQVDWQRGKPSQTQVRLLRQERCEFDGVWRSRVELVPVTGRTHQLRVHAADAAGLGTPIWGDRLYGCPAHAPRLHLHAHQMTVKHPQTYETLTLKAPVPF
ncbi:RluA family pseudouridine synthase [Thermoleptolyngbya sp. PKUAC-SCTB121]|uniref:RluA family pseudouridine synthase n=1 Tax=Thermoleptolyngbya sp. PKUAC-SCTB121 TaxID=2811482 RepID=UPI002103CF98|nr:RluA family pseudouridine synthase [Thermoleptolyngbya sp. PKUAC-SCTB121]